MGEGSRPRVQLPKLLPTLAAKGNIKMKEINFGRAAMLLDIMQKVANVGPMMTSIGGEAGEELKAINEDCKTNGRERADKIRQEEQVAEQQRLQAVADHNAENEKPRGPIQPIDTKPLMPGQPIPGPVGEPSPNDIDRDGIDDSMELEPHQPVGEPIERRL